MPSVLDQICDEFLRAWKQGHPVSIETMLQRCDDQLHEQLLAMLLKLEIEQRQLAGQQPSVADYADRFPAYGWLVRSIIESSTQIEDTVSMQVSQEKVSSVESRRRPSSGLFSASNPITHRQSIGRYTVIGTLGRGGQADVYRAVHPTLPLEVAIKLTHTTLSEKARETLREEAHILCDLDHPHIARVRDFDFDDGRPFMVLDFIRGRSLGQVAAAEPYSPQAAAAVVAKIARAVGFANSRGVIHRDLKPDNVVIDAEGEPKIIDFGMSRLRSGISGVTEEANEVSGTPAYMSPEQADGITAKTDHRVDVFALGAILYRLLVGRAPYSSVPLASMLSVVRQGQWDVAALEESSAPDELKAICKRAMSGDPAQRYATAESMATALDDYRDRVLSQTDTSTRLMSASDSMSTAVSRFGKRPWMFSASGLGCVVSLTIGMSLLLILPAYHLLKSAYHSAMTTIHASGSYDSLDRPLHVPASSTELDEEAVGGLIEQFRILHIGNSDGRAEFSGSLLQFRQPRENDDIQVRAEFSKAVYCFLVALNPDGVKQLCYPRDPGVAQAEPINSLRYPASEDSAFGLTDGNGQQAFVLYTSRAPLPAFDVWDSELVTAPWPDPEVTGNWVYREGQLDVIGVPADVGLITRGAERKTKTPTAFKQLCDRLRQAGSSDVGGVTFEVKPQW